MRLNHTVIEIELSRKAARVIQIFPSQRWRICRHREDIRLAEHILRKFRQ